VSPHTDCSLKLPDVMARLYDEPLAHIMFGHRELFHSNLLAWFFRRMPDAADRVFGSLTTANPGQTHTERYVRREKNNLDLWFQWPGRNGLVIENKVFSLPDETQLAEYTAKAAAGGEEPALWLLSLSDPVWLGNRRTIAGREWRWLSYRELAERIRSVLGSNDRTYEAETMRHYAHVVELLCEIVATVVVKHRNETVSLPDDVRSALATDDDRMMSTMAKLRARSIAHRISDALRRAGIAEIGVESGLTNTLPVNQWFCPIERAPGARAGWQLQGDQFRLVLITPHLQGVAAAQRQARFDFAKTNEDLFDFAHLDEILGTVGLATLPSPRGANSTGFNRYDPDFVYRYKRTPHLAIAQLEAAAVAVAHRFSRGARSHSL
jgi:hypothetical protein